MVRSKTCSFLVMMSFLGWLIPAQQKVSNDLTLKVDESATGPYAGQRSSGCLRVYADGKVIYARWWTGVSITDKETGKKSTPEHTVSKEYRLEDYDVSGLSDFLQSKAVKKLRENFAPPHRPIDYIEGITVQVIGPKGKLKQISTREFYVASLEEKTRYPSALILLMNKIEEIEKVVSDKGKPTEIPPDCRLKPEQR